MIVAWALRFPRRTSRFASANGPVCRASSSRGVACTSPTAGPTPPRQGLLWCILGARGASSLLPRSIS
eukprot:9025039-Lingulodinium_polyedra.AAC.1